jgi:ABC-2 type transport system ATP-binding protein
VSLSGPGPADEVQPLLTVRGVTKRYGEREALRGVSFQAHAGEMVAVIGPNGAGKTTLLSILAGAQRPTSGSVSLPADGVGWVPQQPALYSRLSVAENLELFARLERGAGGHRGGGGQRGAGGHRNVGGHRGGGGQRGAGGHPNIPTAVAAMLDQTGLRERASERVDRLSGGNRQRVNIAIGLLSEPTVLVLDEPSSSLDPRQRERLWLFVSEHSRRERCVIFSTHNVAEAERYAQRVVVLADGELLFDGSPQALARETDGGGLGFETAFVAFLRERGH